MSYLGVGDGRRGEPGALKLGPEAGYIRVPGNKEHGSHRASPYPKQYIGASRENFPCAMKSM